MDLLTENENFISKLDNSIRSKVSRLVKLKNYHCEKLYSEDFKTHNLDFVKKNKNTKNNVSNIDLNYMINKLNNSTNININTNQNIDLYLNKFINNNYNLQCSKKILSELESYKLKKCKSDDNDCKDKKNNIIHSKTTEFIPTSIKNNISKIITLALRDGIILETEINMFCFGNIFYKKKKIIDNLSVNNSRCLIALDNKLKIVNKYLRDTFISPCFHPKNFNVDFELNNKVDQNIHKAKKVVNFNKDEMTFNFETISNIANECIKDESSKIQLDLSNAFNNVSYDLLKLVLDNYIDYRLFKVLLTKQELHELTDDLIDEMMKKFKYNFINLFTFIISKIKFYDNNIIKYIKKSNELKNNNINENNIIKYAILERNKGLPQGCSFSTDIFVMCMDFIIKHIINILETELDLTYGKDYSMICYVDDIMLSLKTEKSKGHYENILDCIENEFTVFKFKMNKKKTLFSKNCTSFIDMTKYNNSIIKDSDKFLGIYYENNISKYLELINNELKIKFNQDTNKHTLQNIDNYIKELEIFNNYNDIHKFLNKGKFKLRLEGSLRYRLTKFIDLKSKKTKNDQYKQLLYTNNLDWIAKYIFN